MNCHSSAKVGSPLNELRANLQPYWALTSLVRQFKAQLLVQMANGIDAVRHFLVVNHFLLLAYTAQSQAGHPIVKN